MSYELFVCPNCYHAEMVETSFPTYRCSNCKKEVFIPIAKNFCGNDTCNPNPASNGFGFNDGSDNNGFGFNNGNNNGGFGFNNGNGNGGFGF